MREDSAPARPLLLLLKGPPGIGKSTLARALSTRLRWPLIDKDDVRDLLDDSNPGLAYEIAFNVVRRQLLQGLSVLCDTPLGYRRSYDLAVRIAAEARALVAVVECVCPDEALWRGRVEARQAMSLPAHHTTDWAAVEEYLRRTAHDAGYNIEHPHLVLDTTVPVPELCERVVTWLQKGAATPGIRCL